MKLLSYLPCVLKPTKSRPACRARLSLEPLERRETPAGDVLVTFASGTLTLTSQGSVTAGRNITIADNGGAGTVALTADGGENFVTKVGTTFTGVNNISVNFGPGNDVLIVSHIQISAGLTINGGAGYNTLLINTFAGGNSFGSVTIKNGAGFEKTIFSGGGATTVSGKLSINDMTRSFTELGTATADTITAGSISVSTGAGGDLLSTAGTINVNGDFSASFANGGGGGSKTTWSANSKIGGKFSLSAASGFDTFDVLSPSSFTVGGAVTINTGNGGSTVDIAPFTSLNLGPTTIAGGAGADNITLGTVGETLTLAGLTINTGSGNDNVIVGADSTTINAGVTVNGGPGTDNVALGGNSLAVTGAATFNLGNGANAVTLGVRGATVMLGGLRLSMGSGGAGTLSLPGITTVNGNVAVSHGHGNTTVNVTGNIHVQGTTALNTQDGFATVGFEGATTTIDGAVTMNLGTGGSNIQFLSSTSTTLGGGLTLNSKEGDDTFTMNVGTINTKSITLHLGNGDQTVNLNGSTQTTINGNLAINSKDGNQKFDMDTAKISGSVSINFAGGEGDVFLGAPGMALGITGGLSIRCGDGLVFERLQDVSVGQATSVIMGDGGGFLSIDDSTFSGATSVHVGDFETRIEVEAGEAPAGLDNGVGTVFHGAVSVTMGNADDLVILGDGAAGDTVTFQSTVSVNPGGGVNTLDAAAAIAAGKITGATASIESLFQIVN